MLNIAMFLGELQLDSQRKVIEGIYKGAKKDGNNIFVYSLTLTLDDKFNIGEYAIAANDNFDMYDGFIIYAESIYSESIREELINKLKATNKPCASIDYYIEGMINISSNNEGAMRELAKHMIEKHNIRTINYISGPEDSIDAIIRKRVTCEEMEKHGLPIDERRFYTGDYYARSGRSAVQYFERENLLHADAYICANDQMALGAFYALNARGINIPDDTLMSGFDDIFQAANHYPRITSVKRFEEKIGECAYDCVVRTILGIPVEQEQTIPFQVMCAESCGCEKGRPISHRIIIRTYADRSFKETRYAELINEFSADTTSVKNYDEISMQLQKYIPSLGGDAFEACLFEEENEFDKVKLDLTYRNTEFDVEYDFIDKNKTNSFEEEKGGNIFVINSIHFGDRCYGYTMIRNSSMPTRSEFYRIFAITLGSTIEHISNVIKMQKMIKTLDEMWVFDPMTHIYNRAGFFKFADDILKESKYNKENLFLLFLDVDGLKKVNDLLGHEKGDSLICDVADILRKCRDKDELLMRYGGDEFVVLGRGYDEEYMTKYVASIRKAMSDYNKKSDREYTIDASIGYSMINFDDDTPLSVLIDRADQKMYLEKREKHKKSE